MPAPARTPAESREIFLAGNLLPDRWQGRDRFVILDTDFGHGLNFLNTWQAWKGDTARSRRLHVIAFAQQPPDRAALAAAQQPWPEFAEQAAALHAAWPPTTPGMHRIFLEDGNLILTLVFAEPTQALRAVDAAVDAFFLSEASAQPSDHWTPPFAKGLARLAAAGATLAGEALPESFHAALAAAEFECTPDARAALATPRLHAVFRSRRPDRHRAPTLRRAIVIGAGIAGSTTAFALARAGWEVCVLDRAEQAASGASSNLAGVLRPLPSADDNRLSRLTRAGYLATRALLAKLPAARWSACGVFHLGRDDAHEMQQKKAVDRLGLPNELLRYVDRDEASTLIGHPVAQGGWYFPQGGWVQPPSVCRAALAAFPERIDFRPGFSVDRLERTETGWRVHEAGGQASADAPVVILSAGADAPRFAQFAAIPQKAARGQVTHLPAGHAGTLRHVVCKHGYAMPEVDGLRLVGATLQVGDTDPSVRRADHEENLARLEKSLPGLAAGIDLDRLGGRTGFRPMSTDRLPIVGPLPDPQAIRGQPRLAALPRLPGLWCMQGFGARGIVWSALMADLLLSRIEGEPLPLENDLVDALDPGRFLLKPTGRPPDDDGFDDRT